MAVKTATTEERIGRIGQRRQVVIPREMLETLNIREGDFVAFRKQADGVLIKPKRVVDPDDVLSPEESAQIAKARREMQAGRGIITPAQLEYDLAHKRSPRRRKTT
jgi:AbrB family looped-hinge helix DNA binding protein